MRARGKIRGLLRGIQLCEVGPSALRRRLLAATSERATCCSLLCVPCCYAVIATSGRGICAAQPTSDGERAQAQLEAMHALLPGMKVRCSGLRLIRSPVPGTAARAARAGPPAERARCRHTCRRAGRTLLRSARHSAHIVGRSRAVFWLFPALGSTARRPRHAATATGATPGMLAYLAVVPAERRARLRPSAARSPHMPCVRLSAW